MLVEPTGPSAEGRSLDGEPQLIQNAKTLGSATPRKPVLSVSARKIKDNAADWHNLILKWETLNDAGFATANSIANLKLSLLDKDKIELETSSLTYTENAKKPFPEYSKELEVLCEELQATLDGLGALLGITLRILDTGYWMSGIECGSAICKPVKGLVSQTSFMIRGGKLDVACPHQEPLLHVPTKIHEKMGKLTSTTKGVCELENYHHGLEGTRPPMFNTWPTAHFYTVACTLHDSYMKELLLKRAICEALPHATNRHLVLSFLSMWLHQPYLESDLVLHLESLLLETGHRPL